MNDSDTSFNEHSTKIISFILGTSLILSIISSNENKKVKITFTEIVTFIWFFYAFYYKDYLILSITILLLFFTINGNF